MELVVNLAQETADIYVDSVSLPPHLLPAHVYRKGGATLITADPNATLGELAAWGAVHLTDAEGAAIRAAYELPRRGEQMVDGMLGTWVPEAVRLPTVSDTVVVTQREHADY